MTKRFFHLLGSAFFLFVQLSFIVLRTPHSTVQAASVTLSPAADAYVISINPNTNYGTSLSLRVDGSPLVRTYLLFKLSGVSGTITQARLRVYANSASSVGIAVSPVGGAAWSETGITYANATPPGSVFATTGAVSANTWKEVDVTGLISGTNLLNLALTTSGGTAISFSSRESGANSPQLVITTSQTTATPSRTATPTRTPTPIVPPPTSTATILPPPPSGTFLAAADATVSSATPNMNDGASTSLRVDGSPVVRSYLRFNVSEISGSIQQAKLRVFANSGSSSSIQVWGVTNNTWSETGITYANAPAGGSIIATTASTSAGSWQEWDVTPLVTGSGLVSLGLSTAGSTAISLASREAGANAPQLVLSIIQPVVVLAAGDIAKCLGGTPDPTNGAMITSDMLLNTSEKIFTLGDNSNDAGTAADYANCYDPTWGRLKARTYPVMGNHDMIADPQGGPYFSYFGAAAHPETYAHYSMNLGGWHIVVLNAECGVGGQGCDAGSPQEQWLRADLAANKQKCIMALWHQPLFTSGTQSPTVGMKAFWQALYDYRADIILNGHNHNYERFAPQDPNAAPVSDGPREFVVGTGGASLDPSTLPMAANEEVRSVASYGYLKLTLNADSYTWEFVAQPGINFTETGSAVCH